MVLSRVLGFNGRAGAQVGKAIGRFAHRLLIQGLARLFRVALKAISAFDRIYSAASSYTIPLLFFHYLA
jgi:hypothetical protein